MRRLRDVEEMISSTQSDEIALRKIKKKSGPSQIFDFGAEIENLSQKKKNHIFRSDISNDMRFRMPISQKGDFAIAKCDFVARLWRNAISAQRPARFVGRV